MLSPRYRFCRRAECRVTGQVGFYPESDKGLGGKVVCSSAAGALWQPWAVSEAVRVNLKLQWRPQQNGDARHIGRLPRKAAGSKQSQLKRKVMWAAADKAIISPPLAPILELELQKLMFALLSFSFAMV